MKRIFLLVISLSIVSSSISQVKVIKGRNSFNQGDLEFGFSANLGQSSTKTKETYNYYNYYDSTVQINKYEYSDGSIYLQIGAALGYYILDGLSIEPEMNINLFFSEFSVSLLGNLSYTFSIPRKNIYPYLKIGYGFSNYQNNYGNSSSGLFESLDFGTLNAGVGLKLVYTAGIALRMEINYRSMSGSNTYSYLDYYNSNSNERDLNISVISLSIGISILF